MTALTRRAVLAATGASAALAAPAGLALASGSPDPLIALCDRWRVAHAEHCAACSTASDAVDAAIAARERHDPAIPQALKAAQALADDASSAACDREWIIIEEIVVTPARTPEGLSAKLRMMAEQIRRSWLPGHVPDDVYERALLSAGADVERLLG